MCRMFGVRGSPEFATLLQKYLISAANGDDFRENKGAHDSGWGGVWYSSKDQKYYRSTTPIFEDSGAAGFFECVNDRQLVGLSHARLAAKGEPIRGPFDSHPFSTHLGEELVYVTHNGHIDKFKLENEVKGVSTMNDTEVFTFLLERVEGVSTKDRLEAAIELLREKTTMEGALNLIVLSTNREGERSIFYHCEFPEAGRDLYYSLYTLKENNDSAIMSSTVAYKAGLIDKEGLPLYSKVLKCPKGKVLSL